MITLTRVEKKRRVKFSGSSSEIKIIERLLTFTDPAKARFSHWAGKRKFFYKDTYPLGFHNRIHKILTEKKVPFTDTLVLDNEETRRSINPNKVNYNPQLRDYQVEAVKTFLFEKSGIIKIATRGGKTFVSAEAVRILLQQYPNMNVVFIADTKDIVNQTREEYAKYLNISIDEIGIIGDSNWSPRQITIATIQTLDRKYNQVNKSTSKKSYGEKRKARNEIERFIDNTDFLIIDEIQEFSSSKRLRILNRFNQVSHLLALSGTPYKSDLFDNLSIEGLTGGIIYEIDEQPLRKEGVLSEYKVLLFHIENEINNPLDYNEIYSRYITFNEKRNRILLELVRIAQQLEIKALFLFSFVKHGILISEKTGIPFLHGQNKSEERKIVKDLFLKQKGGVLFASNIWNKGITLPEVQIIVNCTGGKEQTLVIQKKGRALGTTQEKKKALVIDFIDTFCSTHIDTDKFNLYLDFHSHQRMSVYDESIGSDNVLIVNDTGQAFDLIKDWFYEQ